MAEMLCGRHCRLRASQMVIVMWKSTVFLCGLHCSCAVEFNFHRAAPLRLCSSPSSSKYRAVPPKVQQVPFRPTVNVIVVKHTRCCPVLLSHVRHVGVPVDLSSTCRPSWTGFLRNPDGYKCFCLAHVPTYNALLRLAQVTKVLKIYVELDSWHVMTAGKDFSRRLNITKFLWPD